MGNVANAFIGENSNKNRDDPILFDNGNKLTTVSGLLSVGSLFVTF